MKDELDVEMHHYEYSNITVFWKKGHPPIRMRRDLPWDISNGKSILKNQYNIERIITHFMKNLCATMKYVQLVLTIPWTQ